VVSTSVLKVAQFWTSFLLFLGVFWGVRSNRGWTLKLSSYNKGFKYYLLTCIDVLSRYQWVVPLTDKTGKTLKDAFQVIFKSGRRPIPLSPGENFHDLLGPFLPYSLLYTVVWLAHVTSAGGMPMVVNGVVIRCDHLG
jgi:hypothetical protein